MRTMIRTFVGLVAFLFFLAIVLVSFSTQVEVTQPIAYNHNIHIEQEGLECADCHVNAKEKKIATIPTLEICLDCHDVEPLSDSPEEAKLGQYIETEEEIPWEQVNAVPDHVYFSHRRHVSIGELECSNCHGDITAQTIPATAPFVPITMEWCMDCHKEHGVTNDCLACHI